MQPRLHPSNASTARREVLAVALGAPFLAALDLTIMSVVLPDLRSDFPDRSPTAIAWVVTAYAVVFAGLLVFAGHRADHAGRGRTLSHGAVLFSVGCVVVGSAPGLEVAVAGRALQALGAAALMPASLGMLLGGASPERRPVLVGLWATSQGVAAAAGPLAGAVVAEQWGWRSAFLVQAPIGVLLAFGGARSNEEPEHRVAADPLGAATLSVGLALGALAVLRAEEWGLSSPLLAGVVLGAGASLGITMVRSRNRENPALDLSLLRTRGFLAPTASLLATGTAFLIAFVATPLFLHEVWGYSVIQAGAVLVPGALVAAVVAVVAGNHVERVGYRPVIATGNILVAASAVVLLFWAHGSPNYLGVWLPHSVLLGAGIGLSMPMATAAAMRFVVPASFATGTSLAQTARQIGAVIGSAALFALLGRTATPAAVWDSVFASVAVFALMATAVTLTIPAQGPHQ